MLLFLGMMLPPWALCCPPGMMLPPWHDAAPLGMMLPPGTLCCISALLRMLVSHWHDAKTKKYQFNLSTHGSLFRHRGLFSYARCCYMWLLISSHYFKNSLERSIYVLKITFFLKKTSFSHHINIFFHSWLHFSRIRYFLQKYNKF